MMMSTSMGNEIAMPSGGSHGEVNGLDSGQKALYHLRSFRQWHTDPAGKLVAGEKLDASHEYIHSRVCDYDAILHELQADSLEAR